MQNAKCKTEEGGLTSGRRDLSGRLLKFAAGCLKLCGMLSRSVAGRWIANQLMRCSTSAGANYEEARGAESRADFVHKMQVSLKELRESCYWLRLAQESQLVATDLLAVLLAEAGELVRIFSKSVVTAKTSRPDAF